MIILHPSGPYNLGLSLSVAQAFSPDKHADVTVLRSAVMVGETPAVMNIEQTRLDPPELKVWSPQNVKKDLHLASLSLTGVLQCFISLPIRA